jgi:beta-lactamase superfamily II metal-dependent hydrolase
VLSHGHKDHTGGIFDLINEFNVGTVLLSATADPNEYPWQAILSHCQSKGIAVRYINSEVWKMAEGDEEVDVVEPFAAANPPDKEERENLHSIAVVYKLHKVQVLWTGDLERIGMIHFINAFHYQPLLVKAPHHGSDDSGWEWVWALRPRLVVSQASATAKKVAGDRMKDWLDEANIPVVNTGVDGALEWSSDGTKFNARSYASGRYWEWKLNGLGCGVVQRLAKYLEIMPEYNL